MKTRIVGTRPLTLLFFLSSMILFFDVHGALAQDFVIERFHADIVINQNSTIDILETIEVDFEREKHGIYREIPFRYYNELGDDMMMPITVHTVHDAEGRKHTYRVSEYGDVVNIRIGDADRYVYGRQVYVISYSVENAVLFFDKHEELYWNVTGNQWLAPIKVASALVTLKTDKKSSRLDGDCYTGRYGSNRTDCSMTEADNGILYQTTGSLDLEEGLTVVLAWDRGLVTPPSDWKKFVWSLNLRENWVWGVPLLVFIFMMFLWLTRGRDPRVREAVTVMYEPPVAEGQPLSAAEVGTMVDERLDQRDISAAIVGLAVKGYIKIRENENEGLMKILSPHEYHLDKLKDSDFSLTAFERELMDKLFENGKATVELSKLKNRFYTHIPGLKKTLFSELLQKKFFSVDPDKVRGKYAIIGFAFMFVGSFVLLFLLPSNEWKGFMAGMISGFIIMGFSNAMPAKSRLGSLTRVNILGFREFMNRADRDRLERMGPEVYYKYLPYAIALDVVDHWTDAFEGLLTQPPRWYGAGHSFRTFSPALFSRSITAASSHLGSTMFSAPRGSGSSSGRSGGGGGGFSGGGGGGGGGGSW